MRQAIVVHGATECLCWVRQIKSPQLYSRIRCFGADRDAYAHMCAQLLSSCPSCASACAWRSAQWAAMVDCTYSRSRQQPPHKGGICSYSCGPRTPRSSPQTLPSRPLPLSGADLADTVSYNARPTRRDLHAAMCAHEAISAECRPLYVIASMDSP